MSFCGETSGGVAACQLFSQAKLYSCFLDFNLFAPKSALSYNLETPACNTACFHYSLLLGTFFQQQQSLLCS